MIATEVRRQLYKLLLVCLMLLSVYCVVDAKRKIIIKRKKNHCCHEDHGHFDWHGYGGGFGGGGFGGGF